MRGSHDQIVHNDHDLLNRNFNEVMMIWYTQSLFSIIDSNFRLFTVTLDSNACKNGTDGFFKIYNWLLREIGRKQQYGNFLKLFSSIRNTIHNNGVYVNNEYPSETIRYRGKIYNFEHRMPVISPNPYDLLYLEITPDLVEMMEDIILHSDKISTIDSIPDPMTYIT